MEEKFQIRTLPKIGITVKRLVIPICFLLGRATPNALFVHPRSGDRVEGSSVGVGAGRTGRKR